MISNFHNSLINSNLIIYLVAKKSLFYGSKLQII